MGSSVFPQLWRLLILSTGVASALLGSGAFGGRNLVVLIVLAVVIALNQVILEGILFKDPPFERRQRERLERSESVRRQNRQCSPKLVLCDAGLYPPLASLLFLDLFYRRRVLVWTEADVILYRVDRGSVIGNTLFRGSRGEVVAFKLNGLFGIIYCGPHRLWVHRRYFPSVRSMTPK